MKQSENLATGVGLLLGFIKAMALWGPLLNLLNVALTAAAGYVGTVACQLSYRWLQKRAWWPDWASLDRKKGGKAP